MTTMQTYHLRVHTFSDHLAVVAEWVRKHSFTCLIVEETATRDHLHALFTIAKTMEQWRKDFKNEFPDLEGNKHYGLKKARSELGLEDYLCKGGKEGELPTILERSPSWTDEKILAHHLSYHKRHTDMELANTIVKTGSDVVTNIGMKTIIRQPTFPEKIANFVSKEYPLKKWVLCDENDRKLLYRIMMRKLGDGGKTFDVTVLKKLFNGICLQLCEADVIEHYENVVVNTF